MSAYIELEIHALLKEYTDAGLAADKLIQSLESSDENLTKENIEALARFLWHCGFYSTLNDFVLRHIDKEAFEIPWPYFAEALVKTHPDLDEKSLEALREGILECNAKDSVSRSEALNSIIPESNEWRQDRKYRLHKDYFKNKKNYLDQLVTLRTQQLYEQEKELLRLLQKLYPGDKDVQNEMKEHQQRYALEILSRRAHHARPHTVIEESPLSPEMQHAFDVVFTTLINECEVDTDLSYDAAIAMSMLERYDEALALLELAPESDGANWLQLDLLLKARRYLELLQYLPRIELLYANNADTFFATAYLRAQAMWGIGQKHTAIEILESLLSSNPQYRAAPSILNVWRGQ